MAYSTISKKIGLCSMCNDGVPKPITAGLCSAWHYWRHRNEIALEKRKEKLLITTPGMERSILKTDLDIWFDLAAIEIKRRPFCANCGMWIPEKYYRHASAHIFPKSIFKSIATHPMNFLVLGAGCGCHDQSHVLSSFAEMAVFPLAVEKFKIFRPFIKERHKYLNEFLKYTIQ